MRMLKAASLLHGAGIEPTHAVFTTTRSVGSVFFGILIGCYLLVRRPTSWRRFAGGYVSCT